jgi:hypothetical protein
LFLFVDAGGETRPEPLLGVRAGGGALRQAQHRLDSAWEQKKLEAGLPKVALAQGKMSKSRRIPPAKAQRTGAYYPVLVQDALLATCLFIETRF